MKNKIWFGIFCALIFIALVAGLIFFNKFNDGDNPSDEPLPKDEDTIYATNLFINCPREITVQVGNEVKLSEGFLTIEPSNTTKKVSIEVSSKVGNETGISFNNNTILATDTGFYYIKFSIPKSDKYFVYDTLVVHAVEQTDHILQTTTSAYEKETFGLNEIFNINSSFNISNIVTSNNINYSENRFEFRNVGTGEINVTLTLGYVSYNYKFIVTINTPPAPPAYAIVIVNYETDTIELAYVSNKIYTIVYEITNKDEQSVAQSVTISISDESIAEEVPFDDGFIRFRCKDRGTFILTIIYDFDNSISKELTIILK